MFPGMNNAPGHRALRAGRWSQPGGVYLITFVVESRRPAFRDFHLACAACRTFSASANDESASLLAWVLMPDHFHGLIRLDGDKPLSRAVQRLKSMSSKACHAWQPDRTLWARAFHDHALRRNEDLQHAARYIVNKTFLSFIFNGLFSC